MPWRPLDVNAVRFCDRDHRGRCSLSRPIGDRRHSAGGGHYYLSDVHHVRDQWSCDRGYVSGRGHE